MVISSKMAHNNRQITKKFSVNPTVAFATQIVKHMVELSVWRTKMITSMDSYVTKVEAQIWEAYQYAVNVINESNLIGKRGLLMFMDAQKDEAERQLMNTIARMDSLIADTIGSNSSNKQLKAKILALLQEMRKPRLPDISVIYGPSFKSARDIVANLHKETRGD